VVYGGRARSLPAAAFRRGPEAHWAEVHGAVGSGPGPGRRHAARYRRRHGPGYVGAPRRIPARTRIGPGGAPGEPQHAAGQWDFVGAVGAVGRRI